MTKLMHQGYSWSGRERKCCYLNLGDKTFATVSASSGLDFDDDGRSVAVCDWDGDGDLDLWLRNRTGPQLRFMRNDLSAERRPSEPAGETTGRFLELELVGKTCNRDAIGATAEVRSGERRYVRTVVGGDGYLSQSSKRLHFGLGRGATVDRVTIRWPGGGSQEFSNLTPDGRYRIEQGNETAVRVATRSVRIPDPMEAPVSAPSMTPLVLRAPLPLAPSVADELPKPEPVSDPGPSRRATILVFWAQWCEPCIVELAQLADEAGELRKDGIDLIAVNLDPPADRIRATDKFTQRVLSRANSPPFPNHWASEGLKSSFDSLLAHVRDQKGDWPLPLSFLVDGSKNVQIVYIGSVNRSTLVNHVRSYVKEEHRPATRGAFGGRWYFRMPRDWAGLAEDLRQQRRFEEADFYSQIQGLSPTQP